MNIKLDKRFKAYSVLALSVIGSFASSHSHAAYLYDWDAAPTITDPTGEAAISNPHLTVSNGQDISGAWMAADEQYYYFRMDLVGAPANNDFAGLYGIYIDSKAGGAIGSDVEYMPDSLDGIDYILDSHYEPNIGGWFLSDFHEWDESNGYFDRTDLFSAQQSENGGTTIEWMVERTLIGNDFTWVAATHDLGSEAATYDMTQPATVPVPAPIVLFATSIIGLCPLFRKKRG
ncbi:MAG: hypothetical protein D6B28_11795 [Gammaproteobacteria bacterium]|nr:MAG: hypothetical protein D6B28_11795 [Gammaproteobacteria bacterium]